MKIKSIFLIFILFIQISVFAQSKNDDVTKNLNKQSFEEFGVSKDSIKKNIKVLKVDAPKNGNSAADLNSNSELLKLKNKKDTIIPVPYEIIKHKADSLKAEIEKGNIKKIEHKDADLFSTEPIIKGQKEKGKNNLNFNYNQKKDIEVLKEKPTEVTKNKINEEKPITPIIKGEDGSIKDFSFDTKPIVKKNGKIIAVEQAPTAEITAPKEYKEKQPEEMTKTELEDYNWKKNYNEYQREADSIRYKNKMWLDSVLASLKTESPVFIDPTDYIEIFVSGGGLNGGVNPKEFDRTTILTTGIIQREYKPKMQNMIREEKKISRAELLTLAQYIVDMGFFKFEEYYECNDDDVACQQRMNQYPTPIPLTVVVAIGVRRNTVNVDFFNPKVDKNWVNYPPNLEKILDAIFSVVEK